MIKVHNSSHKKLKFTIYWEYETNWNTDSPTKKMLGINQQTLADLAQISINTITKIENGEININFQKLYAILEVLGLELSLKIKNKEGHL